MSLKSKGILLILFLCFMGWLLISKTTSSRIHLKQSKLITHGLDFSQVTAIELYPLPDPDSFIRDPVIIRDSTVIRELVERYKVLYKNRSGNGKLPGEWQIMVNFKLQNGREIYTRVYHNEYADLVFIQTPDKLDFNAPDDFLVDSNHGISKIVARYK